MAQQQIQMAALQPLPMAVEQQAETYQLGSLTAIYMPRFSNPFVIIALAILAIIVDIALLVAVLSTGWLVYILVIIPFLAIYYAIRGLIGCNVRIYAFSNGLVRAKGRAIDAIRYDQVSQVYFISRKGSYGTISYTLILKRTDGATYKFNSVIKYLGTLGSTVQSEVMNHLLPQALNAYQSGNVLPFGPLNVSQQGIGYRQTIMPLNAIQPIILQRGYLIIKQIRQRSNFAKVRVTQVPNLPAFLGIVKYAQNQRQ